jgi:hypothetical protein
MKTEQADEIAFELVASNERVVEEYTLLLSTPKRKQSIYFGHHLLTCLLEKQQIY